ncbi:HAD family hydrolase [Kineothrix sp. MB12-C1]|uniref:HAD family hydrolase n=1 Tax=Kineothrix sp. MB12-C1 TaxID=3070215 RepID=UPI0027D305C7|nr:HAD family hydrolase [Kineothrix sp. MB12-C1]WMC91890.1 HAD family hydrolase [Kineothrix sp. MB12-C1]
MKYRYLLFDLDGTLTDPKEGITTSVQYALRAFGIDEPDLDKLEPFIGPPLKESFMEFYGFDEKKAEEAVAKYREWFAPTGIFQNRLFPGIAEMLHELKEKGKILAVASSKPTVFVEKVLRHFDIEKYFDVVVGSELSGERGTKEEVVEEALYRLSQINEGEDRKGTTVDEPDKKLDKQHTVMIGDRKFDIIGGKEHGLRTVGVTFGYAGEGELEAAGADDIVSSVEELGGLLAQ